MKKRFLFTTIAAAAFATAALGIAACDDPAPEATAHSVTFDANGGTFAASVTTPVTLNTNGEFKLDAFPTTTPTHADTATDSYAFQGWTLTKDTGPVLDLTHVYEAETTTVYAFWKKTPKGGGTTPGGTTPGGTTPGGTTPGGTTPVTAPVVTFHGNGGAWGTDTEKELTTITGGVLEALPDTPVHPEGKTFKGYTIGTTDTEDYIDVTTTFAENTDVYAQWGTAQQGGGGQGGSGTVYDEGDGGVTGATVSARLKLFVNETEHTIYSNPGSEAATEDYIDSVVLHNGDVITLTDTSGTAVQFRYKASDDKMSSYTLACEPAKPVNIYIKTYSNNNVYELELWNKYDEVGYDKDGNLAGTGTGGGGQGGGEQQETGITVKVAGVDAGAMIINTGHTGAGTQYMKSGVTVPAASAISFTDKDGAVSFFVDDASKGIDKSNTTTAVTSVNSTNTASGTYTFYLLYNEDGSHTLYADDGTKDPEPEATSFDLLKSDGTKLGDFTTNPAKPTKESQLLNISLKAGDVIKIADNGSPLSVWLNPDSKGIDITNKTSSLQSTISVTATGTFTFYMTNNTDNSHTLYCSFVATPTPVENREVYLMGKVNGVEDWTAPTNYKFNKISTDGDANMVEQYKITVTLAAGDSLKVFTEGLGSDNGWFNYVDGNADGAVSVDGNINVNTAGTYDIYFKIWKDGGCSIGFAKSVA